LEAFLVEEEGFFLLGVPPKGSCLLAWSWGALAFTVEGVEGSATEKTMVARKLPEGDNRSALLCP
jgi:hypothetical protein